MGPEIKSSLHLHPELAQLVGLVVADYAMLESLMFLIYAIMTGTPEEAFIEFYSFRSSHLREEKMNDLAQTRLREPYQKAHRRLWRRMKAAARRRTEIAHVTFLSDGHTASRMRLYNTAPHFEPLSPQIFDRTFNQYRLLGIDLLTFAALLSGSVEAIHKLTDQLPSAQFRRTPLESPPDLDRQAMFGEVEIKASLSRLKLQEQVRGA